MQEKIIFLSVYLMLVGLPAMIWLGVFLFLDRKEPEPKRIIFKTILFSLLAIGLAIFWEELIDKLLFKKEELNSIQVGIFLKPWLLEKFLLTFFLAGVLEEVIKFLFLRRLIFKNGHCNQLADGIIYGAVLALGFAFMENSGYFSSVFPGLLWQGSLFGATVFRGLVTTLLHVSVTGFMGFLMAKAKLENKRGWLVGQGLVLAMVAHGVFNVLVFLPYGSIVAAGMVLLLMIYLFYKLIDEKSQLIYEKAKK